MEVHRRQEPATQGRPAAGEARWLLWLAVAFALLRLWKLGEWSLWHDEALALSDAVDGESFKNPLGYLLFTFSFTGWDARPDELMLRLWPAVFGILSVPLIWVLLRGHIPSRQAGAAALLLAVSPWHLYWSQNARFYTLALLLGLIGGALVLGGLFRGRTLRMALGLGAMLAAVAVHPSASFLLVGLVVGPFVARAIGQGPAPGSRAPWVLLLVSGIVLALAGAPWAMDVWHTWVGKKAASPAHFVSTTGFFVSPVLGVGVGLGSLVVLWRRDAFMSTVLCVVATALSCALGAAMFARMSAQYVFVLLPWICLLAAAPVGAVTRRGLFVVSPRQGLGYLALVVCPLLADLGMYFTVAQGQRPRWREAYAYVLSRSEPGDLILGMEAPVGEYYLDPDPGRTDLRRWRHVAYLDRFRANLVEAWSRFPRRTWLVVNDEQLEDWGSVQREAFLDIVREEFHMVKGFPVHVVARDLDVLVYLRE